MKKFISITALLMFLIFLLIGTAFSSDGVSSCGHEMAIVPVEVTTITNNNPVCTPLNDTPAINDAWTTNDPFGNPLNEVYDFTANQDTLAFVVEYYHTGGLIPEQWSRGWKCGSEIAVRTCHFDWTIGCLPAGFYLLINYFDPVEFPAGEYDWASKVGDVVFGWPNMNESRPSCFRIH